MDALNGFVAQETNFPFVSVIVDDASTDNEPQVLRDYFSANFNTADSSVAYQEETDYGTVLYAQHKTNKNCFFAIVLLKENHYSQKKSKLPYLSRWINYAKYIALCEGDDYWTRPFKLQKQVDYLELHQECIMCAHMAYWSVDGRMEIRGCKTREERDLSIDEVVRNGGFYLATASLVFRPELDRIMPAWRQCAIKNHIGDFPLQILAGLQGSIHFFPVSMCVYRYRSNNDSWSANQLKLENRIAFQKNKIEWMKLLDKETNCIYQKAIYSHLFKYYNSLFNLREISLLDYAIAGYKSGQKKFKRIFNDFLRVKITPIYNLLISIRN